MNFEFKSLVGKDLGGLTLNPGIYNFDTSAQLMETLNLNNSDPNAIFVFNIIASTLATANGSIPTRLIALQITCFGILAALRPLAHNGAVIMDTDHMSVVHEPQTSLMLLAGIGLRGFIGTYQKSNPTCARIIQS